MGKCEMSVEQSDATILDMLRRVPSMTVAEMSRSMGVTATAVRQRLTRLTGQELIERRVMREGRGRPQHAYRISEKGRRQTGTNFADLAVAMWQELRTIADIEVRRGLLQRLSRRLAQMYVGRIEGETAEARMRSLARLFQEREVPIEVQESAKPGELPVLKALGCPYTDLAERDRAICSMERMLFSEVLGAQVSLSQCRLDGESCCTFHVN
ncbi:MAG: MarR family transcriptional regulator [Planctomycetales bacterium]|nr:MarR family transcriptional regulator [Planctomycetales bacterium]